MDDEPPPDHCAIFHTVQVGGETPLTGSSGTLGDTAHGNEPSGGEHTTRQSTGVVAVVLSLVVEQVSQGRATMGQDSVLAHLDGRMRCARQTHGSRLARDVAYHQHASAGRLDLEGGARGCEDGAPP